MGKGFSCKKYFENTDTYGCLLSLCKTAVLRVTQETRAETSTVQPHHSTYWSPHSSTRPLPGCHRKPNLNTRKSDPLVLESWYEKPRPLWFTLNPSTGGAVIVPVLQGTKAKSSRAKWEHARRMEYRWLIPASRPAWPFCKVEEGRLQSHLSACFLQFFFFFFPPQIKFLSALSRKITHLVSSNISVRTSMLLQIGSDSECTTQCHSWCVIYCRSWHSSRHSDIRNVANVREGP